MDIQTTSYKRCVVVKMSGRIDSHSAPKLSAALQAVMDRKRYKIVFDMTDVDFLSSAGIWVLVEAQKRCKKYNRGGLIVVNIDDRIKDSLRLVGLANYFPSFDDLTAAVGSF